VHLNAFDHLSSTSLTAYQLANLIHTSCRHGFELALRGQQRFILSTATDRAQLWLVVLLRKEHVMHVTGAKYDALEVLDQASHAGSVPKQAFNARTIQSRRKKARKALGQRSFPSFVILSNRRQSLRRSRTILRRVTRSNSTRPWYHLRTSATHRS
jgi:hypothetical protein